MLSVEEHMLHLLVYLSRVASPYLGPSMPWTTISWCPVFKSSVNMKLFDNLGLVSVYAYTINKYILKNRAGFLSARLNTLKWRWVSFSDFHAQYENDWIWRDKWTDCIHNEKEATSFHALTSSDCLKETKWRHGWAISHNQILRAM